ncbi:MAG TPA: hypothetical protein GX717_05210 [Clostridiaceae bacterium]|nr:hypothetical protein [Clostridiaceae bacterium]
MHSAWLAILFAFFILSLLKTALTDARFGMVPDCYQGMILLSGSIYKYFCSKWQNAAICLIVFQPTTEHNLPYYILSAFCVAAGLILPGLFCEPIGGADIKFAFSLGYIFGLNVAIQIILLGSLLFILHFLLIYIKRHIINRRNKQLIRQHSMLVRLPFIPYLAAATFVRLSPSLVLLFDQVRHNLYF